MITCHFTKLKGERVIAPKFIPPKCQSETFTVLVIIVNK